jgi:hypothetical protein
MVSGMISNRMRRRALLGAAQHQQLNNARDPLGNGVTGKISGMAK